MTPLPRWAIEKAKKIILTVVPGQIDTVEAVAQALAAERESALQKYKVRCCFAGTVLPCPIHDRRNHR